MNKTQFFRKFNELLKSLNANMRQNAERLLTSGAIDRSSYGDDFILPRIVMATLLKGEAQAWEPLHPKHRAEVRNLQHF